MSREPLTTPQAQFVYVVSMGVLGLGLADAIVNSPFWIVPNLVMIVLVTWAAMRWRKSHR